MTAVQEVVKYPKRLIEVDLPIKAISAHARREKSIRHGHISTLHLWWARRPLAACRAVICASLWPDPGDDLCPPEFQERAAKALCSFAAKVRTMKHLGDLCPVGGKRWRRTEEPSLNGEVAMCLGAAVCAAGLHRGLRELGCFHRAGVPGDRTSNHPGGA